jgi:hypothetical protein
MKKTAIASAAIFFSALSSARPVSACGDKLLYLSRIYRHHELSNSTIAVYARPHSLLENAAGLKLDKVLHEEGYHLLLVNSESDLAMAIQSGTPDLVIADMGDVASIQQLTSTAKIPIVPVLKKDDSKSAADGKHYVAVIKAPVNSDKFLDALDAAFDSKEMRQGHPKTPVGSLAVR